MPHNLSKRHRVFPKISERSSKTEGKEEDHEDEKEEDSRERVFEIETDRVREQSRGYHAPSHRFSSTVRSFLQGFHLVIATLSSLICTNFARRFSLCSCDLERDIGHLYARSIAKESRPDIAPISLRYCRLYVERGTGVSLVSSRLFSRCSSLLINLYPIRCAKALFSSMIT